MLFKKIPNKTSMRVPNNTCYTPTFNYFVKKLNGESNLEEAFSKAVTYIQAEHPNAKPGSNYFFSIDLANIPPTDQFFLRRLTYRSCFPPYIDTELSSFEKKAMEYVVAKLKEIDNQAESSNANVDSLRPTTLCSK